MTLQSILQKGREDFKALYLSLHGYPAKNMQGREVMLVGEKIKELDCFIDHHQSDILSVVVEMIEELRRDENMDGAVTAFHVVEKLYNHIYNQALTDIISELKKVL